MTTTLIIPGLNSSGSAHWQTWFEHELPDSVRVVQRDWKRADLPEWTSRVRREITRRNEPVLIAAHSFGALAAVQAAEDHSERILGALLVAPADPAKFGVEELLPASPLGFPVTIVASTNDRWLSEDRAADLASLWGAKLVILGAVGHINAESGFGPWPFGLALLRELYNSPLANEVYASERSRPARTPRTGTRAPAEVGASVAHAAFRRSSRTVGKIERPKARRHSNNAYELRRQDEFFP